MPYGMNALQKHHKIKMPALTKLMILRGLPSKQVITTRLNNYFFSSSEYNFSTQLLVPYIGI